MSGWIKIHRQIAENKFLNDGQPFDKTHAWLDILLNVDWRTGVWQPLSESFLENRWKWSRSKVRRFLKGLVAEKMIRLKTTNHGTTLYVCNFKKYQTGDTTDDTTDDTTGDTTQSRAVDSKTPSQRPTDDTATDTTGDTQIQEVKKKEDKNIKGRRSPKFAPPTVDQVREYCQERGNGINPESFVDFYEARGWKLSRGLQMKDWKAAVRTWEKRDKERRPSTKFNNHQTRQTNMSELEKKLLATN